MHNINYSVEFIHRYYFDTSRKCTISFNKHFFFFRRTCKQLCTAWQSVSFRLFVVWFVHLCLGMISTNARSAVILRIEAERVGIGFRDAEGLVTVSCRIVANVDLVVESTAWVIFDNAEVIVRVVWLGVTDQCLEFGSGSFFGFLRFDKVGNQSAGRLDLLADLLRSINRARTFTRKLESVLNGLACLSGVATLRDFGVVRSA